MLISKEVVVKISHLSKKWYSHKAYNISEDGLFFTVSVDDLLPSSNVPVDVTCDFCQKEFQMEYGKYLSTSNNGNCCYGCRSKKVKVVNMKKYGVENTSKLQSTKDKRKNTFLEKYGVVSNLCLEETKAQIRKLA